MPLAGGMSVEASRKTPPYADARASGFPVHYCGGWSCTFVELEPELGQGSPLARGLDTGRAAAAVCAVFSGLSGKSLLPGLPRHCCGRE
jgi:hypothetical protein